MEQKTEQPTQKKKRDSAKKGQVFKSQDAVTLVLLFTCSALLVSYFTFPKLFWLFDYIVERNFDVPPSEYLKLAFWIAFKNIGIVVGTSMATAILISMLLTRFQLSWEAVKIDFNRLNPVNGAKELFKLRTVKDAVKGILYFLFLSFAASIFWARYKQRLFVPLLSDVPGMARNMAELGFILVGLFLLFNLLIVALDAIAEYFLYIKDLKMSKSEVKRDYKESEGNPEVKRARKELHGEILSEQMKSDVKESKFILANPTHIAIGIYFNMDVAYLPFVSLMEINGRARAIVRYAEKIGVPVLRDVRLARGVYATTKRYTFLTDEEWMGDIMKILAWLVIAEENATGVARLHGDDESNAPEGENGEALGDKAEEEETGHDNAK